jgi:hypothetical protein
VVLDPTLAILERLAETMQRMVLNAIPPVLPAPRVKINTPTFNGQGDVEQFVHHFLDVAEASGWNDVITRLQLREALREGARDCGRAETVAGIVQALRMRFGMSAAEASSRLAVVKRDPGTSLQAYAGQVERLVQLAHPGLPRGYQTEMILRTFKATLGHVGLQRHLLMAPARTIEDVISIGNDFLQIGTVTGKTESRYGVATLEAEDQERQSVQPVTQLTPPNPQTEMMKALTLMMAQMSKLGEQVQKIEQRKTQATTQTAQKPQPRQPLVCWGCQLTGHRRADCPTNPGTTLTGNAPSPRQ